MATRQGQLREQVASLREENQRLEGLVRHQKAGASPAEKAKTPHGSAKSQSQDLVVARQEIMQLRGQFEQLQHEAQTAREELDAVRQREGEAIEQLDRSRAETLNDKREVERLTAQVAELQRGLHTANERAAFAEQQAERFAGELRLSQEEAELQQFRALALQEEKWERREKRLEEQLQRVTTGRSAWTSSLRGRSAWRASRPKTDGDGKLYPNPLQNNPGKRRQRLVWNWVQQVPAVNLTHRLHPSSTVLKP